MCKFFTTAISVALVCAGVGISTDSYAELNPPQRTTIVAPSPPPTVSTTNVMNNPNDAAANNGVTATSIAADEEDDEGGVAPAAVALPNGGTVPGPNNFVLAVGGTGSNVATVTNVAGQNIGQGYGGSAAVAFNPQPKDGDVLLITVTDPQNTSTCHITITSAQNGGYSYNDSQYVGDVCNQLLPPVNMTNQPKSFTINPGQAIATTGANAIPVTGTMPTNNVAVVAPTTTPSSTKFSLAVTGNAANSATVQTMSGRVLATANPSGGAQPIAGPINSGDILLVSASNGMNIDNCHIQIIDADKGGYTYTDGQFPNDTCSTFLPATSVTIQTGEFVITTAQSGSN
jgi:hypothetical protein